MSVRFLLLLAITVAFGLLSAIALADVGYLGIIEPHFQTWGAAQVFVDLVILAILGCVWMVVDSRSSGIPAWPFVAITLVGGSFGVLFYLLWREVKVPARRPAMA